MNSPPPEDTKVLLYFALSLIVTMMMRDALMGPRASRLWAWSGPCRRWNVVPARGRR